MHVPPASGISSLELLLLVITMHLLLLVISRHVLEPDNLTPQSNKVAESCQDSARRIIV